METTRRGFFTAIAGALAAIAGSKSAASAGYLPRLLPPNRLYFSQIHDFAEWPSLPDDVFCKRCGCYQLPDHISASGYEYHTAEGEVYATVESVDGDTLWAVPVTGAALESIQQSVRERRAGLAKVRL